MKIHNTIFSEADFTELDKLWRIYGNNGVEHSLTGHKFIQMLVENLTDRMKNYKSFEAYFFAIKKHLRVKKTEQLYIDVLKIVKKYI